MSDYLDTLYTEPLAEVNAFQFDERVARVFPDMIRRSVPGYPTIVAMTGLLAGQYAQAGSRLYDLGCSLGASTLAMSTHVGHEDCQFVAVDNSPAMLRRCRAVLADETPSTSVDLVCARLQDVLIDDASVVVLNFTLQFIPLEQRDAVIDTIHAGLRPGGILVLSEKVRFEDPTLDELNINLHHQFKLANGYSELEVAGKRNALEKVLLPETLEQHRERLSRAGFASVGAWFQCFNFASLIALK